MRFVVLAFVLGWIATGIVAFIVVRMMRGVIDRFSKDAGKQIGRAVGGPLQLALLCLVTRFSAQILAQAPTETSPHAHWPYLIIDGLFTFVMVLSFFWIGSRLLRLVWKALMSTSTLLEDKKPAPYLPVIYRLLNTGLWIGALLTGIATLGEGAQQFLVNLLGYQAAENSIGSYLAFLGGLMMVMLLARVLFGTLLFSVTRIAARFGAEEVNLRKTWISGLERPFLYLITLIGFRIACELLNPNAANFPNVHDLLASVVEVLLTLNMVWISFIVVDKVFAYILIPLALATKAMERELLLLARKTVKAGLSVVGFIFMLQAVGQSPATVLAGLGLGGLAISFAAKDTLSPLISGLCIYITKPFRIGDFISLSDDTEGTVEDLGLRATTIRTRLGTTLIVPNDKLTTASVQNLSVNGRTRDAVRIALDIATPPEQRNQAMAFLTSAVTSAEGAEEPTISLLTFGGTSLNFDLTYWVQDPSVLDSVRTQILLTIDEGLRGIGIVGGTLVSKETLRDSLREALEEFEKNGRNPGQQNPVLS